MTDDDEIPLVELIGRIKAGGLFFGFRAKEATHRLVLASEGTGETLALMTWFVFGATVIGQSFEYFTWELLVFMALITVIFTSFLAGKEYDSLAHKVDVSARVTFPAAFLFLLGWFLYG